MTTPVTIRVLKDGRVRVHFFVRDEKGPIRTEKRDLAAGISERKAPVGGSCGYIACQPELKSLQTPIVVGRLRPIHCTADLANGAVTCPECMATEAFQKAAEAQAELEASL